MASNRRTFQHAGLITFYDACLQVSHFSHYETTCKCSSHSKMAAKHWTGLGKAISLCNEVFMKLFWVTIFLVSSGLAVAKADLTNKSTRIGINPFNPKSEFVKCVVELGVKAAFGSERHPWFYSYDEAIGSDTLRPKVVAINFIDRDINDLRKRHKVFLTSNDKEKRWQYVRDDGDIFFFSTRISRAAVITDFNGTQELARFDISNCQ